MMFGEQFSWVSLGQIVWVDLLLSADNAVVIAMACRGLDDDRRKFGIALGSAAAIGLRIVLTGTAALLMQLPGLQIVSAIALLWVAATLVAPVSPHDEQSASSRSLWRAVRLIAIADTFMSLDNAIAIAAVARGSILLLVIGLVLSIPLIVAGSSLVLRVLDRYPLVMWLGCALIGWIAGELFIQDRVFDGASLRSVEHIAALSALVGAGLAVLFGWRLRVRAAMRPR